MTTTHLRKVGHSKLKRHINALSKVASVFNGLWSQCSCESCSSFGADAFLSVGGCLAAKAVVEQCKRERYLEATALGVGKATGTRDPALPDGMRLPMVKEMLLGPTSAADFHSGLITAALFVLSFFLEARGATTRGLRLSDLVMRKFPSVVTEAVDVLCTYVYATKTKENQVLCLGSLPHVDPWRCPFRAVADALVAARLRPSHDPHVPPVDFAPDFEPSDETLKAVGVEPRFYRANGVSAMRFRKWYHWVLLRSPRGEPFTGITYKNHLARLKRAASGSGVPEKASLTHTARQGAAQKAKEAGASEADNNKYGQWGPAPGDGAYNAVIPDPVVVLLLSGRSKQNVARVTPRLTIEVPTLLQQTLSHFLEEAEKAYTERVKGGAKFRDVAPENFFKFVRVMRSVFFPSWAARLCANPAPDGAYVTLHPLLRNPEFERFRTAAGFATQSGEEAAGEAAAAVLPQLGVAVKAAVEATAASAAGTMLDMERALSLQMDAIAEAAESNRVQSKVSIESELDSVMQLVVHLQARLDGGAAVSSAGSALPPAVSYNPPDPPHLAAFPHPTCSVPPTPPLIMPRRANPGAIGTAATLAAVGQAAPIDSGACFGASPSVRAVGAAPSAAAHDDAPSVCTALLRDRESVRKLRMQQKLRGVTLFEGPGECVPLLPLELGTGWARSLDEYATGLDGLASVREVEAIFGQRWWHLIPDPRERNRRGHHYSTQSPIYRAFATELALRGAAVGVDTIVQEVKNKYRAIKGGSSAVYKQAAIDYPKPK